jgi:glycosyltransferase involved in cell wall biosynthesis
VISVVIPTIHGREDLLATTLEAFKPFDVELIVVRNEDTCGKAWNAGAEQATGDYLMLGADDLIPENGEWSQIATSAADAGVYPAPWIVKPDGSTLCAGTLGQGLYLSPTRDGIHAYNSPIPFMRRETWDEIGPSLPIHYHADDFLAYKANFWADLKVQVLLGYKFIHLDGQVGRARNVALGEAHRWVYAEAVSAL